MAVDTKHTDQVRYAPDIEYHTASSHTEDRYDRAGAAALQTEELLALVGIRVSADTLDHAGGLHAIMDEPDQALGDTVLGQADRRRLAAVRELHQRWLLARCKQDSALTSPNAVRRFLEAKLRGRSEEAFCVLFLDNRHRVIRYEELFHGDLDGAAVYPRVVVRRVLVHNAAAVIAAHCHPSGIAEPSPADRTITEKLKQALGLIDVRLLDHFVIGDGEFVSFSERGWLP